MNNYAAHEALARDHRREALAAAREHRLAREARGDRVGRRLTRPVLPRRW